MTDKHFNFWQKWLTWANVLTIAVGLMLAFFGNSIFFDLHNHYTKEVFTSQTNLDGNLYVIQTCCWNTP